ncbi:MAG: MFS transporter [Acidimicrobiaceae bacterium]|nr:MFS transporter [Acidimicrobiaceae bacterium]
MSLKSDPNIPYYAVTAVLIMGYGSVLTLLAEFRNQFGFSETQLGLVTAAGFLAGFVAQIALAPFADRGRTAQMIPAGVALAAVSMLAMVWATQLWAFVAARVLFGFSAGAVSPAMRRLIITRDPENVGQNLGRLTAVEISGFVLGPASAAAMVELGGLRVPFIALGVANAVMLLWVTRLDLHTSADGATKRKTLPLLKLPKIQAALLAGVAFYLTIAYFETTWAVLLDDLGAKTWLVGVSLSLFTVPMIVLAPTGGRLTQKLGHSAIVGKSITAAAVCTALYGWVDLLWPVLLISLVHAVADAFTLPANQVAIATACPPEQAAAGQGLFSGIGTLVSGMVALVAGFLYETTGPQVLYTTAATAMMALLAVSLILDRAESAPRRASDA